MDSREEELKQWPATVPMTYLQHDEFSIWYDRFNPKLGIRSKYYAALQVSYLHRENPNLDVAASEDMQEFPVYLRNFLGWEADEVPRKIEVWKNSESFRQVFVHPN